MPVAVTVKVTGEPSQSEAPSGSAVIVGATLTVRSAAALVTVAQPFETTTS